MQGKGDRGWGRRINRIGGAPGRGNDHGQQEEGKERGEVAKGHARGDRSCFRVRSFSLC